MREDSVRKAEELVARMTVEEAASQLLHCAPAIERLMIPAYNWWNEALHGVARAGVATVFPQAIGLAAMFDETLLHKVAEAVAEEARAKYNVAQAYGDRDIYKGLTFWSPNINIFRDPRWGRGQETYGEDPYLTSRLGVAFITGLQGSGETMKAAACAKHFACYSGPEEGRHSFNAVVSPKDLEETYLPAFEAAVREGKAEAVMGAYNALNGEPCCANSFLLNKKLRGEWGFAGHVVSDCWAVADFHQNHHFTENGPQSASIAVRRGCDLNCGCTYENLMEGLRQGLIKEEEIRRSCVRVFTARFRLGMFGKTEYDGIPYEKVACPAHKKLALRAARESIVLLKNDGILPLDAKRLKKIAVIGPNADSRAALYGNYNGDSGEFITDLAGIRAAAKKARVFYSKGSDLCHDDDPLCKPDNLFGEAVAAAKASDVVVLCVGYDGTIEGEEGDAGNYFASGDRRDLLLPPCQRRLCEAVLSVDKPVIFVVHSGGGIDVSEYEGRASAILQVWYSGERGGEALADIIFGKISPSGRLPVTVYRNGGALPPITEYSMQGRTYRYLRESPLYPFGFGLSYTSFSYGGLSAEERGGALACVVTVENTGGRGADEVVQIYLRFEGEAFEKPNCLLVFFRRVHIGAGKKKKVRFALRRRQLESVTREGERKIFTGCYTLFAGGYSPSPGVSDENGVQMKFTLEEGETGIVFRKEQ